MRIDLTSGRFTVHDAASLLLKYLKSLPEPVIPLEFYNKFITTYQINHTDDSKIARFKELISDLPPFARSLLIFLLDLFTVLVNHSDENMMDAPRIVSVFHPALLSHPALMGADDFEKSAQVIIFLIENQASIAWQGNAAKPTTDSNSEPQSAGPKPRQDMPVKARRQSV